MKGDRKQIGAHAKKETTISLISFHMEKQNELRGVRPVQLIK